MEDMNSAPTFSGVLVAQCLLTFMEHMNSAPTFSGVLVAQSLLYGTHEFTPYF